MASYKIACNGGEGGQKTTEQTLLYRAPSVLTQKLPKCKSLTKGGEEHGGKTGKADIAVDDGG